MPRDNSYIDPAKRGDLETIKKLRSYTPPDPWYGSTCAVAAKFGHLHIIEWARAQIPPCPWDENTCNTAVRHGHLHIIEWLRAQDPPCPWSANTCTIAVDSGRLDMLQWLRQQNPPCPWDSYTCHIASYNGRWNILQWLRTQNPPCPMKTGVSYIASNVRDVPILTWLICCDIQEIPYTIDYATWYNGIVRPMHTLLVVEVLEDIYHCLTCRGDVIPKDITLLIGEYANVRSVMFDDDAKKVIRQTIIRYWDQPVSPELRSLLGVR